MVTSGWWVVGLTGAPSSDEARRYAAPRLPARVTPRPLAGRHPIKRTKGSPMQATCSSYPTEAEARAAVEQLIADGMPGARIFVITGQLTKDHRDEHVGAYAGDGAVVGAFAGAGGSTGDAMGSFAGGGDERRGGFGDADRDVVTTYAAGVSRMHVASHRELEQRLASAGLDADAIATDVRAVHEGRVLVLVEAG
jgi:hypothetical protein